MYSQGQPQDGNYPGYPSQPGQPPFGNTDPGATPSAPPASMFEAVSGYEHTSYDHGYLPPPPLAPVMAEQPHPDEQFVRAAAITAEDAKEALVEFVASQCCYGSGPANEMEIRDIRASSAYHYKLSTFTESRSTAWQVEPYTGQIVDGLHNGPAPGPWDVIVQPSKMFSDSSTLVEVPHTASVKQCHNCFGGGFQQCMKCFGRGWDKCATCQGRGYRTEFNEEKQCSFCLGAGQGRCRICNGGGRLRCPTCQGHCQLKTFIQLTVTWKNHEQDFVVERSHGGPKQKVTGAAGTQIFHQELPRVWPISTFFDNDVNIASQRIVTEHGNAWPRERILMQRQSLRAVPVAEVSYTWTGDSYVFWVYGLGPRKVFAPDYPQQCCCGCVIL